MKFLMSADEWTKKMGMNMNDWAHEVICSQKSHHGGCLM